MCKERDSRSHPYKLKNPRLVAFSTRSKHLKDNLNNLNCPLKMIFMLRETEKWLEGWRFETEYVSGVK